MAGVKGLEPSTFCVTGRRSNQTELHPHKMGHKECLYQKTKQKARSFLIFLYPYFKDAPLYAIMGILSWHNNTRALRREPKISIIIPLAPQIKSLSLA